MTMHDRRFGDRPRPEPYRITLVGRQWHVTRPRSTLDHAFGHLEEAEAFVRHDSAGLATYVELIAGSMYMVKQLRPRA